MASVDEPLRARVRRLRLYYKSTTLFRACLAEPAQAWLLPWLSSERQIALRFRSGRQFTMLAKHWALLPTACRLDEIGAEFEFTDDSKRVELDGLTLFSPLWTRNEAAYYKEVFVDDVYRVKNRNLAGQVVIDVGAYVGDTTIAFARQGATVHAIEPSHTFCHYIRRNLEENGLTSRAVVHEVGLSDHDHEVVTRDDRLRFTEGIRYTLAHLPARVDLLKLDCEGAEYHLLGESRFLDHLAPREIRMEYHRGLAGVVGPLEQAGYVVKLHGAESQVGLLTATRKA